MKLDVYTYQIGKWDKAFDTSVDSDNTLIIIFGTAKKELIQEPLKELQQYFPKSTFIGASTAGEIVGNELYEESLVVAVMSFKTTTMRMIERKLSLDPDLDNDGVKLGKEVANELFNDELKAVFVLTDGLHVNGSKLTKGISSVLPKHIVVTGGLAGDDDRFESTWVIADKEFHSDYITAVGFYGDNIHVSHGSKGGWDSLGIERLVTKSKDNILYELDSQPALEIYKRYLGEKANELPASGLLFPLELKDTQEATESKVRTILAVNEEDQSITFAGDIPEGSFVTLMKANFDRLIDGAYNAADMINLDSYKDEPILSIAISCVGRRLVLKQRIEEELEATLDVLPESTRQIGFYSYGEISPLASGTCDLHNQTMTLTTVWESDASPS